MDHLPGENTYPGDKPLRKPVESKNRGGNTVITEANKPKSKVLKKAT